MDNKSAREILGKLLKEVDEMDENTELHIVRPKKLKEALKEALNLFERDYPIPYKEKVLKINDYDSVSYKCDICGWNVELSDWFCKHCGQRLKKGR